MYILLSPYLPTHSASSFSPSSLSFYSPSPSFFFLFTVHSLFLLSLSPFLLFRMPLFSTLSLLSLFGNTALFLALLFPIYASLFISLFLFLPFFLLPHWLFSLPPFFFPSSNPPSTPSFLFHSSAFRPHTPPQRPLPSSPSSWVSFPLPFPSFSSNHLFFSPVLPFFDIPILIFFPVIIASSPAPPTLALSLGPITPFVFPFFPSNRRPSSPFSPFRLLLSPPSSASLFCPPNGSHYSFRPCPSSIQSWSSLPPSSPSMPFPRPPSSSSLCPILSSRRNWGCIASFIFSCPSLCPHAILPFIFLQI